MRIGTLKRNNRLAVGALLLGALLVAGCDIKVVHSTNKPAPTPAGTPVVVDEKVTAPIEVAKAPAVDIDVVKAPVVQAGGWGNIKGRVVWGGAKDPERTEIKVGAHAACLVNPTADKVKGTILDEDVLVNAKNKGLKNVFVYFMVDAGGKIAIHPDLQKYPAEVAIDQPACMFWPRALTLREGQAFVVKNSSTLDHNIRWIGDEAVNKGGNVTIKPNERFEIKDLKSQRLPLPLECNIHGWMKGRLGVFSHPYYAVTDDDGKFEIKNAPSGDHKLMIYHETIGYRLGSKGKLGEDITVKAGDNDLKDLPMGK